LAGTSLLNDRHGNASWAGNSQLAEAAVAGLGDGLEVAEELHVFHPDLAGVQRNGAGG
jgi:hypothetical protein